MHASKCTRPSLRPHCSRHTARCRPAAAAASDVYRPPSVAPALSELALLAQFSKIVPDQLQLPSTVEGVQLATAASVTFGQLRAIAASLNSTPLQVRMPSDKIGSHNRRWMESRNCIAAARNYHPDPERQVRARQHHPLPPPELKLRLPWASDWITQDQSCWPKPLKTQSCPPQHHEPSHLHCH
ncbi:hypothetical protein HaLaN_02211 [Haematococcus lacustris]|uniref:Uncharacterized protein n=1 Tax=Haematococcus lacustris TaxID=44745 RepID=A0A699YKC2_HAELA|nr:hypothetical protein HaLaN_02211 [Haematococcus lacustris]